MTSSFLPGRRRVPDKSGKMYWVEAERCQHPKGYLPHAHPQWIGCRTCATF